MAVLGDSITRGFDSCAALQDCPEASWSTGASPAVRSHASRIAAVAPGLTALNLGVTGAASAALPAMAAAAVAARADYVEVLMGANDACRPTEAQMTPVAAFRANYQAALAQLAANGTRVFAASIPDVEAVWRAAKDVPAARAVWATFRLCQSLLADPLSTEREDRERRTRVRERVQDYNTAIQQACAATANCRFDHRAVFKHKPTLAELSPIDFYHPSVEGQRLLSERTWEETYRFRPAG
nr:GDSL-type esterase/lipase family protein [Motilibacter aurantiacus]